MNPTFSTGAYYGDFTQNGYEEIMTPITSKRSRDNSDLALADSLELFAIEAKRKRIEPSYNSGMPSPQTSILTMVTLPVVLIRIAACRYHWTLGYNFFLTGP